MSLTPQQRRILELLCQGRAHKQIADEVAPGRKLSPRTIETYIARLRLKFGVKTTLELVALFSSVSGPTRTGDIGR